MRSIIFIILVSSQLLSRVSGQEILDKSFSVDSIVFGKDNSSNVKIVNQGGTIANFPVTPIVPDVPSPVDVSIGKQSAVGLQEVLDMGAKTTPAKGVAAIPVSSFTSNSGNKMSRPYMNVVTPIDEYEGVKNFMYLAMIVIGLIMLRNYNSILAKVRNLQLPKTFVSKSEAKIQTPEIHLGSHLDNLSKIKSLLDDGVISVEEYVSLKTSVLKSIPSTGIKGNSEKID